MITTVAARAGWAVCGLLAALAWPLSAAAAQAAPTPTVIVDIHDRGHDAVQALRSHPDVRWSAEFGNELLMGIAEDALPRWLERADARPGPSRLAFDEVLVRDHVCPLHDPSPALAVVGGFEILRRPAALVRAPRPSNLVGIALPVDGVVAREVNNTLAGKQAGAAQTEVLAAVQRVSGDRWFDTMSELATFNRNSFSASINAAHDWVRGHLASAGLETSSHAFTLNVACSPPQPPVNLLNPVGFKRGEDLQHEWIVVGGHYDSRNHARCDGSINPQPGANDNASGCAGVIELARVFRKLPTRRSIVFACFAGEEQGLVGSYRYVQSLVDSGDIDRVQHMINLDMIGHAVDDSLSARVETTPTHTGLLAEYAVLAATYAPELNLILSSSTQAYSDHWPFLQAGIPSVFTWENGAGIYPDYHQVSDVPENMLFARELAGGILKMDAAMLGERAGSLAVFFGDFESRK